jgi:hypothetical protein
MDKLAICSGPALFYNPYGCSKGVLIPHAASIAILDVRWLKGKMEEDYIGYSA